MTASHDDELLKWVARMESAKGPAARRTTAEMALREVTTPELRDRIAREAAKIEVRATMDKVDTLKTRSAKERYLLDAVAVLRADSAPDELQAPQIQQLEDALRELRAVKDHFSETDE